MSLPQKFARLYEERYEEHGDSHKALGWPDQESTNKRFGVMMDIVRFYSLDGTSILDFGCGLAHLYDYIWNSLSLSDCVDYHGLDASSIFIDFCREKHPTIPFYCLDILDSDQLARLPDFDYIIVNGVFTEKVDVGWDDMWTYCQEILTRLWSHTKVGLAVNTMSDHVDWKRDDLFHLPFHTLASFIRENLSNHFLFRQDYGLYEYTTYIYRDPS